MAVTLVSGVPGVGASAVCEAARRKLEDGYELENDGSVEAVAEQLASTLRAAAAR